MKNDTVFILLAGGKSERMGVPKGLLEYHNTYWIIEQIERIATATITQVYIGLGYHSQEYLNKIPWLEKGLLESFLYKKIEIRVIINNHPERGSFSTLQLILKHLSKDKSVLINPIDVPIVNTHNLQTIIEAQNQIVLPNYKGKNGHPIKLHPNFWERLLVLNSNDINSRLDLEIKKMNPIAITSISVNDSCSILNLNTPSDWLDYLK